MKARRRYITMNVKPQDYEKLKEIAEEHKTTLVGALRILITYRDVVENVREAMNRLDTKLDVILKTLVKLEEKLEKERR